MNYPRKTSLPWAQTMSLECGFSSSSSSSLPSLCVGFIRKLHTLTREWQQLQSMIPSSNPTGKEKWVFFSDNFSRVLDWSFIGAFFAWLGLCAHVGEGGDALGDWLGLGHMSSVELGELELTLLAFHQLSSGEVVRQKNTANGCWVAKETGLSERNLGTSVISWISTSWMLNIVLSHGFFSLDHTFILESLIILKTILISSVVLPMALSFSLLIEGLGKAASSCFFFILHSLVNPVHLILTPMATLKLLLWSLHNQVNHKKRRLVFSP